MIETCRNKSYFSLRYYSRYSNSKRIITDINLIYLAKINKTMKTNFFLMAITIAIAMYSCEKSNSDYDELYTNFSFTLVDAQTQEGLIDTTANAYYHVDSIKLISQSGEIHDNLFIDTGSSVDYGYFGYGPMFYLTIALHQTTWQEEDFVRLYGEQMDTTMYLYLNQYETDTLDIKFRLDSGISLNYNHNTIARSDSNVTFFIEKNINNTKK